VWFDANAGTATQALIARYRYNAFGQRIEKAVCAGSGARTRKPTLQRGKGSQHSRRPPAPVDTLGVAGPPQDDTGSTGAAAVRQQLKPWARRTSRPLQVSPQRPTGKRETV
jgi:hypothetical protein